MKIQIITDCLDLLAGFQYLEPYEKKECFQQIIDVLGSYPKPQKKTDLEAAKPYEVATYLFVSNIRNACKLSILEFISNSTCIEIIQVNCECALSVLTDNIEVKEPKIIQ